MTDGKLLDGIIAMRLEGSEKYEVSSTPTFLLNDEKISAYDFDAFDTLLRGATA